MHDAFISSLNSHSIRQRLLENKTLDLQMAYTQTSALDLVQQNNELYTTQEAQLTTLVHPEPPKIVYELEEQAMAMAYQGKHKCFFCGFPYHLQDCCPTQGATCKKRSKKGHYVCTCQSKPLLATMVDHHVLTMCANVPQELHPSVTSVVIYKAFCFDVAQGQMNGAPSVTSVTSVIIKKIQLSALLDFCSTDSYISDRVARELKMEIHPSNKSIILAQKTLNTISREERSCKFTSLP